MIEFRGVGFDPNAQLCNEIKLPFAQNNEGAQNNAGILEEVLDTLDNLVYIDQCPTTHETRILL